MIEQSHRTDTPAAAPIFSWGPLSQSPSTARLVLLLAALTIPLCSILCMTATQSAWKILKSDFVRSATSTSAAVGLDDPARHLPSARQ
jgi:hypothetical protein